MTSQQERALDRFGNMLVAEVYDQACVWLKIVMSKGRRGNTPDLIHEQFMSLDANTAELVKQIYVAGVEQTFAHFLCFLDDHAIPLPIEVDSGAIVDVKGVSDGLAAEPFSETGWIAKYSRFKKGIDSEE